MSQVLSSRFLRLKQLSLYPKGKCLGKYLAVDSRVGKIKLAFNSLLLLSAKIELSALEVLPEE